VAAGRAFDWRGVHGVSAGATGPKPGSREDAAVVGADSHGTISWLIPVALLSFAMLLLTGAFDNVSVVLRSY